MKLMPQEIEVWYLIPAIRREISNTLIKDYNLKQKQIAELLGITESAISQYQKSKRAKGLKFSSSEIEKIKESTKQIVNDKENITKHLFDLTVKLRGADSLCALHRKHDPSISESCSICMN